MSFAFLKKAFSFKKNIEENHTGDFLKTCNGEAPCNSAQMSKAFRKNALRLIVIRKSNQSVVFDSSLNKESTRLPTFGSDNNKTNLSDIAFGSFSLNYQNELKSSVKLHDLMTCNRLLFTYVYYPSPKRTRSTKSVSYGRKQPESTSVDFWSSNTSKSMVDAAVAICVLVNVDWAQSLSKPTSSGSFSDNRAFSFQDIGKRFYSLIFEHFLQISVSFQTLSEFIGFLISGPSVQSRPSKGAINEIHEKINRAFMEFQRSFRDLCIPRLCRPVWPSLSLAYISQLDASGGNRRPSILGSSPYTSFIPNIGAHPAQFETMSSSFVRGCLCSLISSYFSKDHCLFLAQLVTGVLMQHRGWISTVLQKASCPSACYEMGICGSWDDGYARVMLGGGVVENSLLAQMLVQFGCDMNRHQCEESRLLNSSGSAMATTVLFGGGSGGGGSAHQQQQHRERLLALLYLASYFVRPPQFLLQAHEQLPDMGFSDIYEVEHRKRQRSRAGSSSGSSRRKSSAGQLSVSLRGGGGDIHDSGIASQEDLNGTAAAMGHYSSSAGAASPSPLPPVGPAALCLPGRLTSDQCRIAEAAAQALVSRELAAAAGKTPSGPANKASQLQPPSAFYTHPPAKRHERKAVRFSVSASEYAEAQATSSKQQAQRGHTWTSGRGQRVLSSSRSGVNPASVCSSGTTSGGDVGKMLPPYALAPSISAGVPCFSNSVSPPLASVGDNFTEIPLLIQRWYDCNWDRCMCLGDGLEPNANSAPANTSSSSYSSTNNPLTVHYGASVERSSSLEADETVEVGTACHADMTTETASSCGEDCEASCSPSRAGGGGGPELTLHSAIGANVLEHYTSGLALQATTEAEGAFRSRLLDDLRSWLRFAPSLLHRAVDPPPLTLNPLPGLLNQWARSRTPRLPTHHQQQMQYEKYNTYRCSALLVNVDNSSVELVTMRSGSGGGDGRGPAASGGVRQSRRTTRKSVTPLSNSATSPLSLFLPVVGAPRGSFDAQTGRKFSTSTAYAIGSGSDSEDAGEEAAAGAADAAEGAGAVWCNVRPLVGSPLVLRMLQAVRAVYERSGGCASLALHHLETELQNICLMGCLLADLLVPAITSPDGGPDAPFAFKETPELVASIIGCQATDLPLLLSIAGSLSCKAAAVIERHQLDQTW